MHEYSVFATPLKQPLPGSSETAPYTPSPPELEVRVDYKAKTFKLMRQLTESEVASKKSYVHIRQLEKEVDSVRFQLHRIYSCLRVSTTEQAQKRLAHLSGISDASCSSNQKIEEWSNLIEEYKRIINAQQYKFIKQEQQLKIADTKLRRFDKQTLPRQEASAQTEQPSPKAEGQPSQSVAAEIYKKDKEVVSLNEELSILKNEFRQMLMEKQKWKEQYSDLQQKYNMEIEHFEQMEKHVEERLIEVEKEMNFYRDERETHIDRINLLKKEVEYRQNKKYFSFGGVRHVDSQTEVEEEGSPYNYECLQISIKTLLEENSKLKNTLLVLFTKKPADQLPKQIELELKILLNMHDSNARTERNESQRYGSTSPTAVQNHWAEDKIEELKEEYEEQGEEEQTAKTNKQEQKQKSEDKLGETKLLSYNKQSSQSQEQEGKQQKGSPSQVASEGKQGAPGTAIVEE